MPELCHRYLLLRGPKVCAPYIRRGMSKLDNAKSRAIFRLFSIKYHDKAPKTPLLKFFKTFQARNCPKQGEKMGNFEGLEDETSTRYEAQTKFFLTHLATPPIISLG